MKLDTESKMKFDDRVSTEDRFAIRKWFQKFIDFQNAEDSESILVFLHPQCRFEGFGKYNMDQETFAAYLERKNMSDVQYVVRYPEMQFKVKENMFKITGTFEEFSNGALTMEGLVDIKVVKQNGVFLLLAHKFFPRLIIHQDE